MSTDNRIIRPLPVADVNELKSECQAMLEWIGEVDMPEERVGLREAAGNIGGILIGLMHGSTTFYTEEAANVSELSGVFKDSPENNHTRARILHEIFTCSSLARDKGCDIEVDFEVKHA
jgi:hypothetical protein